MLCGLTRRPPHPRPGPCGSETLQMPPGPRWSVSTMIPAPRTRPLPAWLIRAEHRVQGEWKGSPFSSQLGQPSLPRKEKASFGPEPESISHGAALLRERPPPRLGPSPAAGGPQSLPGPGHPTERHALLARAPGLGALPSDLLFGAVHLLHWGFTHVATGSRDEPPPFIPPDSFAVRPLPSLLHLTIVAFSHRCIDLGNSP